MSKASEVMAATVDALVDMLEAGADGADWSAPWHVAGDLWAPRNPVTNHSYRGGNVVQLAMRAMLSGAGGRGEWSTFKGWQSIGAMVRKGEKGTAIIRPIPRKSAEPAEGSEDNAAPAGIYWGVVHVFAAEQVDGYAAAEPARASRACRGETS
jgi:antirestriction protein ArdC